MSGAVRIGDGLDELPGDTSVFCLCNSSALNVLQRYLPNDRFVAASDDCLRNVKKLDVVLVEIEALSLTAHSYLESLYHRFQHSIVVIPFSMEAGIDTMGDVMSAKVGGSILMEYQAMPFSELLRRPLAKRVEDIVDRDKQFWRDGWDSVKYLTGSIAGFFNLNGNSSEWWQNRRRLDTTDLVRCIFDKAVLADNPSLTAPSGFAVHRPDYILFRLENFEIERQFDSSVLSQVFISHRNSPAGLEISKTLHSYLNHLTEFEPFVDKLDLTGGGFRTQLTEAFLRSGVLLCVLTEEPYEKLEWVRRELHGACIMSQAWGTPIPVVLEAGFTIQQLVEMEHENGVINSRLETLPIDRYSWDPDPSNLDKLAAFLVQVVQRVRKEREAQP